VKRIGLFVHGMGCATNARTVHPYNRKLEVANVTYISDAASINTYEMKFWDRT
jgi:hypothetical protein